MSSGFPAMERLVTKSLVANSMAEMAKKVSDLANEDDVLAIDVSLVYADGSYEALVILTVEVPFDAPEPKRWR